MEYVINLLKEKLDNEYIALYSAQEITRGNGMTIAPTAMDAFRKSRRLAEERIPQLEQAIKNLSETK